MEDFFHYRKSHEGPKSLNAFNFWLENGGKDLESFQWNKNKNKKQKKNRKPYHGGRRQAQGQILAEKGSSVTVNMYF